MSTEVLVPPLGQTVDTMTFVSWYKQEGEAVRQGEPLYVIETDKASLDVEAPASGILRRVTAKAGDEVKALTAIAVIAGPAEVVAENPPPGGGASPVSASARPAPDLPLPATPESDRRAGAPTGGAGRRFISPRARKLAESEGVPLADLTPTGPESAIIERDVRAYLDTRPAHAISPVARRMAEEAGLDWRILAGSGPRGQVTREDVARALAPAATPAAPVAPAATPAAPLAIGDVRETIPVQGARALIAERMARSSAVTAPVTLTSEADATALVELRRSLVADAGPVSYNDLLLYIVAHALAEHPRLNASLDGDVIKLWRPIHIGLAVDTDRGLLVPVVRDVAGKGLLDIAAETSSLVERARAGRCTPDELRGGTFTLTNLGGLGIDAFTPIINLPECAILGVGRIKPQAVPVGRKVKIRQMVWLSLTFDHRLVDGAPAARFLQRVVQLVEHPHLLLA